jgi:hypothetical protein
MSDSTYDLIGGVFLASILLVSLALVLLVLSGIVGMACEDHRLRHRKRD